MKITNKYFSEIMDALRDALEHEKGTKKLRTKSVRVSPIETLMAEERKQAKTFKMKKSDILTAVTKVSQKSR